jgi:hypothetical protein
MLASSVLEDKDGDSARSKIEEAEGGKAGGYGWRVAKGGDWVENRAREELRYCVYSAEVVSADTRNCGSE